MYWQIHPGKLLDFLSPRFLVEEDSDRNRSWKSLNLGAIPLPPPAELVFGLLLDSGDDAVDGVPGGNQIVDDDVAATSLDPEAIRLLAIVAGVAVLPDGEYGYLQGVPERSSKHEAAVSRYSDGVGLVVAEKTTDSGNHLGDQEVELQGVEDPGRVVGGPQLALENALVESEHTTRSTRFH